MIIKWGLISRDESTTYKKEHGNRLYLCLDGRTQRRVGCYQCGSKALSKKRSVSSIVMILHFLVLFELTPFFSCTTMLCTHSAVAQPRKQYNYDERLFVRHYYQAITCSAAVCCHVSMMNYDTQRKKLLNLGSNSWFSLPGSYHLTNSLSGARALCH